MTASGFPQWDGCMDGNFVGYIEQVTQFVFYVGVPTGNDTSISEGVRRASGFGPLGTLMTLRHSFLAGNESGKRGQLRVFLRNGQRSVAWCAPFELSASLLFPVTLRHIHHSNAFRSNLLGMIHRAVPSLLLLWGHREEPRI